MSTIIVTSAEIYADSDSERACASVMRRGGNTFAVRDLHLGVDLETVDDYAGAVASATAVADQIDNAEVTKEERVTLSRKLQAAAADTANAQAAVAAAEDRVSSLSRQADSQGSALRAQQAVIDSLTAQLAIAVAAAAAPGTATVAAPAPE